MIIYKNKLIYLPKIYMKRRNKMRYEIALSTEEVDAIATKNPKWILSDEELQDFIWAIYKLGYSVYRGYDDQICFTLTDEEVTEIKEK